MDDLIHITDKELEEIRKDRKISVEWDKIYYGSKRRHVKLPDGYKVVNKGFAKENDMCLVVDDKPFFSKLEIWQYGGHYADFYVLIRKEQK